MRTAAIDIGTNSARLLVVETDGKIIARELARETMVTRLGEGVHDTGYLKAEAIERTLKVLKDFSRIIKKHRVQEIKAVATSAVREAKNADDLLLPARKQLGVRPDIIAGEKEADLAYRGVLSDPDTGKMGKSFLVIDIGGGSTEIILGDNRRPEVLNSLPLGCVRLMETFQTFDPPSPGDITALRLHANRILSANFSPLIGFGTVPLAVAGTPTSLAAIELKLTEYDRDKVHRRRLTRQSIADLLKTLMAVDLSKRQAIIGLSPDRADVIIPGAAILLEIMTFFNFDFVIVSERDILDGIALSTIV